MDPDLYAQLSGIKNPRHAVQLQGLDWSGPSSSAQEISPVLRRRRIYVLYCVKYGGERKKDTRVYSRRGVFH